MWDNYHVGLGGKKNGGGRKRRPKNDFLTYFQFFFPNLDVRMKILDYNLPYFKCKRRWGLHVLFLRIFGRTICNLIEKNYICNNITRGHTLGTTSEYIYIYI